MILTARCDHCCREEEVTLWNAADFELGECSFCGEGMCEKCVSAEEEAVHQGCEWEEEEP
jgi:hypothetical protein